MPFRVATQLPDFLELENHLRSKSCLNDSVFRKHAEIFSAGPDSIHDKFIEAG
jgi:hypothetical protein